MAMDGPKLPWWARAANAAWTLFDPLRPASGGPLGADELLAFARAETGLDELALEPAAAWDVRAALGALTADLAAGQQLSLTGRLALQRDLRGALSTRLRLSAALGADPSVAGRAVQPPIVIAGLPRTGTTLLHNLLAEVPGLRAPRLWELLHPLAAQEGRAESARREVADQLDFTWKIAPGLRAVHPMRADGPEECVFLLRHSVASTLVHLDAAVPTYLTHLLAADLTPVYREHRLQLQLLQGGGPSPRWVLKAPHHRLAIEALLAVYPSATVVLTHREMDAVAASGCSLMEHSRAVHLRDCDPHQIGAEWLALWSEASRRVAGARAAHPGRFVDLDYAQLVVEPVAAVEAVLRSAGVEPPPDLHARVAAWSGAHPPTRHGVHRYALGRYGLSSADVASVA